MKIEISEVKEQLRLRVEEIMLNHSGKTASVIVTTPQERIQLRLLTTALAEHITNIINK